MFASPYLHEGWRERNDGVALEHHQRVESFHQSVSQRLVV